MPRRSSGRSAPRAAPRATHVRNPPQPVHQTPAPAQSGRGSILGSIGSTIAEGMTWGTGTAMAHRVVDAIMGPIQYETVVSEAPTSASAAVGSDSCGIHTKAFQDCINSNGRDISKCQFYLDMLKDCRLGSGATA